MVLSLIDESAIFIKANWGSIFAVMILLFLTIIFSIFYGSPPKKGTPTLKRVVIIEKMTNQSNDFSETIRKGFCSGTNVDFKTRHNQCSELSKENCNSVECCVYGRPKGQGEFKCVAGDKSGATIITKPPIDEYYYLGKLVKN